MALSDILSIDWKEQTAKVGSIVLDEPGGGFLSVISNPIPIVTDLGTEAVRTVATGEEFDAASALGNTLVSPPPNTDTLQDAITPKLQTQSATASQTPQSAFASPLSLGLAALVAFLLLRS